MNESEKDFKKYNLCFNSRSFCFLSFYPVQNFRKIYTGQVFKFRNILTKRINFIIINLWSVNP